MANALYDKFREDCLSNSVYTATVDIDADTIQIALVKTAYAVNLATDTYLSTPAANIPSATWKSGAVSGVSCTAGVFNHTAKNLVAVASDSGNAATRILYYKFLTGDSTSPLICYIDTFTPGNTVTPNGGDILITPDTGANKVFKL